MILLLQRSSRLSERGGVVESPSRGSVVAHLIIHNFSCLKNHLAIFSPSIKHHSSLSDDDIVSALHPMQLQWTTISYHWVSLARLFSLSSTPSITRWKTLSLGSFILRRWITRAWWLFDKKKCHNFLFSFLRLLRQWQRVFVDDVFGFLRRWLTCSRKFKRVFREKEFSGKFSWQQTAGAVPFEI